jgi:hypothetical protein
MKRVMWILLKVRDKSLESAMGGVGTHTTTIHCCGLSIMQSPTCPEGPGHAKSQGFLR